MKRNWKLLARHKWVNGAIISELHNETKTEGEDGGAYRRFVATVNGWRNFKIWEGFCRDLDVKKDIIGKVSNLQKNPEWK